MAKKPTKRQRQTEKVARYKDFTGKKRISSAERKALDYFTVRRVSKGRVNQRTYDRRLRQITRQYGNPSKEARELLQFATVGQVIKLLDVRIDRTKTVSKTTSAPRGATGATPVMKPDAATGYGDLNYDDLPNEIKKWARDNGSWLYNTKVYITPIDTDYLFGYPNAYGNNSAMNAKALRLILPKLYPDLIYVGSQRMVFRRDEWEAYKEAEEASKPPTRSTGDENS